MNRLITPSKKYCLAILAAITLCGPGQSDIPATTASEVPLFQDGTRCAFIGDSITQGAKYYAYIELYYLTPLSRSENGVL